MGGFTTIRLKDTSEWNINRQNVLLREFKIPKKYSFYSQANVRNEYDWFKRGEGAFPESQFPRHLINCFADFQKYWNTEALGEIFCPKFGTLSLDCYFGRTSKRAMRNIGKYLAANHEAIASTSGSFSTFVERGMTKKEAKLMEDTGLLK